ncbi:hypothetical protein EJ065_2640 [Corallococcus coralloides]|uniref:Uncharacterized protein n=1 Tax=Corallococcus coralloides TaxID=184914 RepID=A0A410RQQ4_CORCK|nr:hypothetical protein [Corallococcus coralloides]QAT84212.1 hypothetical protein EJ065_2640 [Corallococcus coralloides]
MIASLKAEKIRLEAITANDSGRSLGEVAAAFTVLKDVAHRLSVLEKGTGLYKGNRSGDPTASVIATDCTEYVIEVLSDTFKHQKQTDVWVRIKTQMRANMKTRGATNPSGLDLQAALQQKLAWEGIFWAPDPKYPKYEWKSVPASEQSFAYLKARESKSYYKATGNAQAYPGISIGRLVVNYAPESNRATPKDTKDLNRLKKVAFGVFSAHGGYHMCLIISGIVYEVHWDKPSTSERVMEGTPLESWGGLGRWGSGAIVAPRADVEKAWRI